MQTENLPKSRIRGLDELEKEVGDVSAEIESRIGKGIGIVRVLEIGCGYGTVMADLVAKFGDKIELHGINMFEKDGNPSTVKEMARLSGFTSPLLDKIQFHYFDVCHSWPMPDNHFDVIYSQSVFLHLPDRVTTFHEINRTLKTDGIARIEACLVRPKLAPEYRTTFVIKDGDRILTFEEYSRSFANIRFKESKSPALRRILRSAKHCLRLLRNSKKKPVARQPYMEMTKGEPFNLGLALEEKLDVFDKFQIKKSVYRVNGQAEYPKNS